MSDKNSIGQKLNFLLFQKGMRAMDLARQIDVPQPTLHRILNGKSKKPHQDTLNKIADFFNLGINELINETPLWHYEHKLENKLNNSTHEIPLVTIQEDQSLDELVKGSEKTLIVTNDISAQAFAIILNDESLFPIFHTGSTLIFDPLKKPNVRNYVFVLLGATNKYTIRQLLTDEEHYFLKPLNPDIAKLGIKLLEEQDQIIAPLVEARQSYL